jgi:hypothetical protein
MPKEPSNSAGSADAPVRGVLVRVDDDGLAALSHLAVDLRMTLQAIGIEALNDFMRKHGRPPVIRNPRLKTRRRRKDAQSEDAE